MSLLAAAHVGSANAVNVALLSAMGNATFDSDVVAKIQANAPFLNISVINVATGTPDVGTLEGYRAVLLMSNSSPFGNSSLLGSNLKQYLDDGFGLVVAGYGNTSSNCTLTSNYQLCGAFQTSNYWAIAPGNVQSGTHLTLGSILVPDHPILADVTSFDGGTISGRVSGTVNASATRIANWSDGTPLIATRTFGVSGIEVGLNFFPPSADAYAGLWVVSTGGGKLLANSILYAGNISADPPTETPEIANFLMAGAGLTIISLLLRIRC